MNLILTADTHFTDKPIDDYRWNLFPFLSEQIKKYDVQHLYILGDLVDVKDRFTGDFINFLVDRFTELRKIVEIYILAGNHDKPLYEPYFWEFLNKAGIRYLTKPDGVYGILLLPFSNNAVDEWKEWLRDYPAKSIFMHQTVEGAVVEDGRHIPSNPYPLPKLPDNIPIFSGDVHRPQEISNLVYVGAPYPVRFSENWNTRVILIKDDDFKNPISIPVPTIRRAILDISSYNEIGHYFFKPGDQLKIRYQLNANDLGLYPEEETRIKNWAQQNGIMLVSLEPSLVGEGIKSETAEKLDLMPAEDVMKAFAKQENLSEDVIKVGVEILNESK